MRHRSLERAAAAGVALSLLAATVALADTIALDADGVAIGDQSTRDLGDVAPGASVDAQVLFVLDCGGTQHVDRGQSVTVGLLSASVPPGGDVAMAPVALGPVPVTWPLDGEECSGTETPIAGVGTVTVTAPTTLGAHAYPLVFELTPTPAGSGDGSAAPGSPAITFFLDVVGAEPANTPPSLVLPGDMTVVADGPAGWTASYVVTATDAEDDPDPSPTCAPAVGEVLPLGTTTTVSCSVTDAGGLTTSGSFAVTVEAERTEPEPEPDAAITALFGSPVKADGLDGRAGRTIPLKVHLAAGDIPVGEGSLSLVVAPCAGGDPVAELEMEWRPGSERWFGLLRTRALDAGCYAVRAVHDDIDVGGFELRLFDKRAEVAKNKAGAANAVAAGKKAAAADGKAAANVAKEKGKPAERGGNGKGRP